MFSSSNFQTGGVDSPELNWSTSILHFSSLPGGKPWFMKKERNEKKRNVGFVPTCSWYVSHPLLHSSFLSA